MNTAVLRCAGGFVVAAMLLAGVARAGQAGVPERAIAAGTVRSCDAGKRIEDLYATGDTVDERGADATQLQLAARCFARAAALGHVESMNRLGMLFADGRGVPRDYHVAVLWYRRAMAAGSAAAVSNLATLYFYGLGVPRDFRVSAELLERPAADGDAAAQNKLAALYLEGLGVARDERRAREWLERSAAQQYAPAMANLGRLYLDGIGGDCDVVAGTRLLDAALALGLPESLRIVAEGWLRDSTQTPTDSSRESVAASTRVEPPNG